jgi:hypothetical protein
MDDATPWFVSGGLESMIARVGICMLVPCLLAAAASAAGAECDWRIEVERAAAMIDQAREPVARSGSPEAREMLRAAAKRLRQAQESGRRGEIDFACRLARASQDLARKAGEIAKGGVRGLDDLERMLRTTDDMIRDAEARLRGKGKRSGAEALRIPRQQQNEAWSAFRNRRPRLPSSSP